MIRTHKEQNSAAVVAFFILSKQMDLGGGHENHARPDLTIPMPASFVAGATAAAAAQQQQQQDSSKQHPQQSLKLLLPTTNNGSSTPSSAAAPPPAAVDNNGPDNSGAAGKKAVRYRECLKNHAAGIGGHALDGCGEFMPNKEDETSLKCAACDCHRNFHRREVEGEKPRQPSQPQRQGGGGGGSGDDYQSLGSPLKKRFRTKFSSEQKERMYMLSEKLGWRIQKHDEAEVAQFCADTGVKRHVLKVWMHNNKHTFSQKKLPMSPSDHPPPPHEPT